MVLHIVFLFFDSFYYPYLSLMAFHVSVFNGFWFSWIDLVNQIPFDIANLNPTKGSESNILCGMGSNSLTNVYAHM
jgi:hypothetical protein